MNSTINYSLIRERASEGQEHSEETVIYLL